MVSKQQVRISQLARSRKERVGYYRWLGNEYVELDRLVEGIQTHCSKQIEAKTYLVLTDRSEVNLQGHAGRLKKGVGVVGNNRDLGFFIQPSLVLDESGMAIGLSSIYSWTREVGHHNKQERNYRQQPIEEKESNYWLLGAQQTKQTLAKATQIIQVADRESDIYEEWSTIPDERCHLLIRACRNRKLKEGGYLFEHLSAQDLAGNYELELKGDARIGRSRRTAHIEVRFSKVRLQRPAGLGNEYPEWVELYAVEAKEVSPPAGEPPIHWRILTTYAVHTLADALQVIEWYSWRWGIEEVFRLLMKDGFDIEDSLLSGGVRLSRGQIQVSTPCKHSSISRGSGNSPLEI